MTNSVKTRFSFFLSETNFPIDEKSGIWEEFLPEDRHMNRGLRHDVTYGDYFSGLRSYLAKDRHSAIRLAIGKKRGRKTTFPGIDEIRLFLKKHGGFYHPARIEARADGSIYSFVLNAAISDIGKECVKKECRNIKTLNSGPFPGFLPAIYDQGEIETEGGRTFSYFLGEWFEGYSELHISRDPEDNVLKLKVWDEEHGYFFLSPGREAEFYERAAFILTCFYDLETFDQVFPWHHAAGDFTIKCLDNRTDVKLVTARQLAPMFGVEKAGADSVPEGALFFLLNMSIRMRLDRIDGTEEIAWAGDYSADSAFKGFMKALALKKRPLSMGSSPDRCFYDFISSCSYREIRDMAAAIVGSYNPGAPDMPVVKKNIDAHIRRIFDLAQKGGGIF